MSERIAGACRRRRAKQAWLARRRHLRRVTGVRTGGAIVRGTWVVRPCGFPTQRCELAVCSRPTEVVWPFRYRRRAPVTEDPPRLGRAIRDRRSAEASGTIASTAAFFVAEAIFRSPDRRCTRCCRSVPRQSSVRPLLRVAGLPHRWRHRLAPLLPFRRHSNRATDIGRSRRQLPSDPARPRCRGPGAATPCACY